MASARSKKTRRARGKRLARVDDFYRLSHVGDPVISPDGKSVAYTVSAVDREADRRSSAIWIASLGGRAAPRAFASIGSCTSPAWSPDGESLAFASNRGEGAQVFVARLDGGDPRAVTGRDGARGASQIAWSPDGRQIAFVRAVGSRGGDGASPAERAAPRVIRDLHYRLDGVGFFGERRRHVFVVDAETGDERQITNGDCEDTQPTWSPDGKSLAFVSDRGPERGHRMWRSDLWLVPVAGSRRRPRRLTRGRGLVSQPQFSPNGRRIVFAGHEWGNASAGRNVVLMTVPVRGRSRPPRIETASLDRSVAGSFLPSRAHAWLPDGKGIVFLAADCGTCPIWRLDLKTGTATKIIEDDLQVNALDVSPDGKRIVFTGAWSSELPEVSVVATRGGRRRRVSNANEALAGELDLIPTERLAARSSDGREIASFLLRPPGRGRGGRHPVDLNIHGGPHGYNPSVFNPLHHQVIAAAGYAVLMPNPRGSSSYGEEFERACVGDWAGGDFRDVMAAVDELERRGIADPERLYVGGYSYGGYLSSWTIGQTDRFRAAVIGAPITNLASTIGTTDVPQYDREEMGGAPWEVPEEYSRRSPITHVKNVRTPALLLHFEGDLRCPMGQSEEFFVALKLCGVEVELVRYPGGSHAGRTPSQEADMTERTLAWYARHAPR